MLYIIQYTHIYNISYIIQIICRDKTMSKRHYNKLTMKSYDTCNFYTSFSSQKTNWFYCFSVCIFYSMRNIHTMELNWLEKVFVKDLFRKYIYFDKVVGLYNFMEKCGTVYCKFLNQIYCLLAFFWPGVETFHFESVLLKFFGKK